MLCVSNGSFKLQVAIRWRDLESLDAWLRRGVFFLQNINYGGTSCKILLL